MTRLLVDTDAFVKLGLAGLLEQVLAELEVDNSECGRLAALPYMLKRGALVELYGAAPCAALVPRAEGMPLAPMVEKSSLLDGLAAVPQIDTGEAQLFAAAAEQKLLVLTGDKRSLIAVASVEGMASALSGRIVTIEAVLVRLCDRHGAATIRAAVQPLTSSAAANKKDKMLQSCFSSGNSDPQAALLSYFGDLARKVAPMTLWPPRSEPAG